MRCFLLFAVSVQVYLQDEYGCIDTCSAKHLRMVWTFIAAWFCYNSPFFPSEESIRRANSPDEVANLDVSRSVLQRVAQGFADFIVENSRREDRTVGCNGESGWHLWVAGIFKGILGHQLGFARSLQNICHRHTFQKVLAGQLTLAIHLILGGTGVAYLDT